MNGLPDVPMYLVQQFERGVVDPLGVDNDPLELKRGCSAVASTCRLTSTTEQGGDELKLALVGGGFVQTQAGA